MSLKETRVPTPMTRFFVDLEPFEENHGLVAVGTPNAPAPARTGILTDRGEAVIRQNPGLIFGGEDLPDYLGRLAVIFSSR